MLEKYGSGLSTFNRQEMLGNLMGFALTLAVATYQGWSATDLVWGLWLSSLVLGLIYLLVVQFTGDLASGSGFFARLFTLVFFIVHFGGFHFVHAVFLGLFFPLGIETGFGGLAPERFLAITLPLVIRRYWPIVLSSAVSRTNTYIDAYNSQPGNVMFVYKNVVRMHLFILIFAFLRVGRNGDFSRISLYLLLFFYFFPTENVRMYLKTSRLPADKRATAQFVNSHPDQVRKDSVAGRSAPVRDIQDEEEAPELDV